MNFIWKIFAEYFKNKVVIQRELKIIRAEAEAINFIADSALHAKVYCIFKLPVTSSPLIIVPSHAAAGLTHSWK